MAREMPAFGVCHYRRVLFSKPRRARLDRASALPRHSVPRCHFFNSFFGEALSTSGYERVEVRKGRRSEKKTNPLLAL